VVGIAHHIHQAAAGLLMERELEYLGRALTSPERPLVAILGGAKVSDKIGVVQNLMRIADAMVIGGAMAYTFLKSEGIAVGRSLVEDDKLDLARDFLRQVSARKFPFLLPVDHVVATSPDAPQTQTLDIRNTPAEMMGLDIGPKTVELFRDALRGARTILWNGPLGMFEKPAFAAGTLGVTKAVAEATRAGAISIVGGGDSVAAVHQAGVSADISHISTGGGASLEFLAGRTLPGVAALTDKP
jgi:phosphoglycerate kinase